MAGMYIVGSQLTMKVLMFRIKFEVIRGNTSKISPEPGQHV